MSNNPRRPAAPAPKPAHERKVSPKPAVPAKHGNDWEDLAGPKLVPTGVAPIDYFLGGGQEAGEVNVFLGPVQERNALLGRVIKEEMKAEDLRKEIAAILKRRENVDMDGLNI